MFQRIPAWRTLIKKLLYRDKQDSSSVNQNNSYITAPNECVVCNPLVRAIDWPKLEDKPMAVPLASLISDKIQSKIWTNEYVDFGTLTKVLYKRFKVQFCCSGIAIRRSAGHKSGASAKTETYSPDRSMAHSLSNLCSDLYGAVSEQRTSLNKTH